MGTVIITGSSTVGWEFVKYARCRLRSLLHCGNLTQSINAL